jgi:2-polyprenyl-3-methyl-5-hydroxy-6-metoxy-1,4-benzoquinol methylase
MPIEEDLKLAYQDYYTHAESEDSVRHVIGRVLYRLATDAVLAPTGIPMERRRTELMFLDNIQPGRLLDVGCGSGAFLARMNRRGWTVTGIDFDPIAIDTARKVHGVDAYVGTVASLLTKGVTFDAITASHVIEHVADPVEFLAQCRQLLSPRGRLVLRTPNAQSFGLRRYGSAWRGLEPPRHLHIFTGPALSDCALKAGFDVSRCFTSTANSDTILAASRFLRRRGSFRMPELPRPAKLEIWLIRPLLALQARLAWLQDRYCGEELCAVLTQ